MNKKTHASAKKRRDRYWSSDRRRGNKIRKIKKAYHPGLKNFSEKHLQELLDKVGRKK